MGLGRIYRTTQLTYEGTTAPSNTNIFWIDTSSLPHVMRFYDQATSSWQQTGLPIADILLPADQVITDSNNRFVTDAQIAFFSDHYTQVETDNKFNTLTSGLNWKQTVATYADIATTYPSPLDGWTVNTQDTEYTYRYDATISQWIPISANAIPLASDSTDGKMSAADKQKLDNIPSTITTSLGGKADLVSGAVAGNFAGLNANGDLTDSGWNSGMFVPISQFGTKADKVLSAHSGNFAGLDQYGNITDSTFNSSSFAPSYISLTVTSLQNGKVNRPANAALNNFAMFNSTFDVVDSGYSWASMTSTFANINHTHPIATEGINGFLSTTDKIKLDSVQSGAQPNVPSFSSFIVNSLPVSASVVSDSMTLNSSGVLTIHVSGKTLTFGVDGTQFAPKSHVGSGGEASHPDATSSLSGFMSASDKAKLDALTVQNSFGTFDFVDTSGSALPNSPIVASSPNTSLTLKEGNSISFTVSTDQVQIGVDYSSIPVATETVNGFMSANDKTKLDNLTVQNTYGAFAFKDSSGTVLTGSPVTSTSSGGTFTFQKGNGVTLTVGTQSVQIGLDYSQIATSSSNGFLSSTDKAKLDSVASGATNVQSSTTLGNILINGVETPVGTKVQSSSTSGHLLINNVDTVIVDTTQFAPIAHVGSGGNAHAVVTTSANGFMLASDKAKLDNIAVGATNVQASTTNGNIVINGVETTVYSGSGSVNLSGYATTSSLSASTGAGLIGITPISGLSGSTVQDYLASLKTYTDSMSVGIVVYDPVMAISSTNITLNGLQTIDGYAVQDGDRILINGQTDATTNGIYLASSSGNWVRSSDTIKYSIYVYVKNGTTDGSTGWVLSGNGTLTVGTSPINFTQYSGSESVIAGIGLSKSGDTLSLASTGVIAGTYTQVQVNTYGQVTSGSNPTTLAGYGITDATPISHVGSGGNAHALVTGSVSGFMSSSDKEKLDGVQTGATNVQSSITNGNIVINGVETTVYDPSKTSIFVLKTDLISSTGASSVGITSISGLTGTTVQDYLQSLKSYIDSKPSGGSSNAIGTISFVDSSSNSLGSITATSTDNVAILKEGSGVLFSVSSGVATVALDTSLVATDSNNGFMASSDKTKIDSISATIGSISANGTTVSATSIGDTITLSTGSGLSINVSGKNIEFVNTLPTYVAGTGVSFGTDASGNTIINSTVTTDSLNYFGSLIVGGTTYTPTGNGTFSVTGTGLASVSVDTTGLITVNVPEISGATSDSLGVIQLTGDLTGTSTSPTLAPTGVTAGSYVNPTVTVDLKGRITSIVNGDTTAQVASTSALGIIQLVGDLTGTGDNPQLINTGVTAGSYSYPQLSVDAKGRITNISTQTLPDASTTQEGLIKLAGDLTGTATNPILISTGVTAGTYANPTITVDVKGRVTSVTSGDTTVPMATSSALGLIQLAGDITGTGDNPQLVNTGVTAGTYSYPRLTVDTKGRITSISPITLPTSTLSQAGLIQLAGDLTGSYTSPQLIAISGLTAGTYSYPQITIDNKGRITAVKDKNNGTAVDLATNATTATNANALGGNAPSWYDKHIIRASVQPASAMTDDLWIDTSVNPHIFKRYDGSQWNVVGDVQQIIQDGVVATTSTWSSSYIKAQMGAIQINWNQITSAPNSPVSQIDQAVADMHVHTNMNLLNLLSVDSNGLLMYNLNYVGDMTKSAYDSDGNGAVDRADTLVGLTAKISELNQLSGITGNVQNQLNNMGLNMSWKGHVSTYADIATTYPSPQNGWLIIVDADETQNGHKTIYIYNISVTAWQFIGQVDRIDSATNSVLGTILMTGDLAGTGSNPQLTLTGVTAGTYNYATITVDSKGRITSATNNVSPPTIDDTIASKTETWSSYEINQLLATKLNTNDPDVHSPFQLGTKMIDETSIADNMALVYSATAGKIEYQTMTNLRAVGDILTGNVTLLAGSNITLTADPVANSITIASTASGSGSGGGGVPTLVEVDQTAAIPSGGSATMTLAMGYDKYDIRTISFTNDIGASIQVQIYDRLSNGDLVYQSNLTPSSYDIVNVPCQDKDGTQSAHLVITNTGLQNANVTVKLKVTSLS